MDVLSFIAWVLTLLVLLLIVAGILGTKYNFDELKEENKELKQKLNKRGK